MTEQSKWVSEDTNQAILQGIRDLINQHLTSLQSAERAQELDQTIQEKQAEIERQYTN